LVSGNKTGSVSDGGGAESNDDLVAAQRLQERLEASLQTRAAQSWNRGLHVADTRSRYRATLADVVTGRTKLTSNGADRSSSASSTL